MMLANAQSRVSHPHPIPMYWILAAYVLALALLTFKPERFPADPALRKAWTWVAIIPMSHFAFALLRVGNYTDPRDLMLIGLWEEGIAWLLLGLSILALASGIAAKQTS
jgi:hypothetical protein